MNPRDLFERYLSLFDRAQKEAGGGLWVVWDHFEKVLALVDETFIVGSIRKCLIGNRQVRWLVSITPPTVMDRLIGSKESPFFGLFECFKFGGLTYRESMKFMEVQKEMKALPSSSLSFLVALTGGHPFYLNVLSDGMEQARRVLGRRVNAQRLILETLTRELFAGGGRLHLYFRGLLAESFRMWRAPELYLGMLEAIARGQSSLVGISHALRREAPALSRQIQNLLDSGLVAKEGIFYFIPDPLFRFWIRHVHLAKRSARRLGDTGIESFRNHFEVLLKDFLSSTEMETVQRIAQILTASDGKAPLPLSGRSESIDNALDLLPRFDQVEMQQKLLGETFDLIARRGNEYWLLSVFEIVPTPSKLTQFSKQVGRVREAIPENQKARSVVIALGGFSQAGHKSTVRLQLDVWDRSGLNRLAECYGFLPIVG